MSQNLPNEKNIYYKLAPTGMYILNTSERAIITFKDHFIAGLCTMDPELSMQNWDRLLEQADIKINLLHPSRLNPRLPAYAQLNREFYFNRTPMAPPGENNPGERQAEKHRHMGPTHTLRFI